MSYEEKGVWVYLVVTLGTFGSYVTVILGRARGGSLTGVAYVSSMLWTIGIAIVLATVVRTMVETARPSDSRRRDARDKAIGRFGEYVGGVALAGAMAVPFVLAMAKADYFWIANAMYAAFVLSAVTSSSVKIVTYRRGL